MPINWKIGLCFSLLVGCGEVKSVSNTVDAKPPSLQEKTDATPSLEVPLTSAAELQWEVLPIKTFRFTWKDVPGATHYKLLEQFSPTSGYQEVVSDIPNGLGELYFESPLYLYAAYILRSCNSKKCVDSSTIQIGGNLSGGIGYFKASNTDKDDIFGHSIALSQDAMTLVVGAPYESSKDNTGSDNSLYRSGAAYVYTYGETGWKEQGLLKANNLDAKDLFGMSVAISADGKTIAIGAPVESSLYPRRPKNNQANQAGAVYIFQQKENDNWTQVAYLKEKRPMSNRRFGNHIVLSSDGKTLVASSRFTDNGTPSKGSGAVLIFHKVANRWKWHGRLESKRKGEQFFGESFSISNNGKTLAIGSKQAGANHAGAVYIYRHAANWKAKSFIQADNAENNDWFGYSLSLSGDGKTVGIGSPQKDNFKGAAYIFKQLDKKWEQQSYIQPNYVDGKDQFGTSVAMQQNGDLLAVSSYGEDSLSIGINGEETNNLLQDSGAVYIFDRSSGWRQHSYLKAPNPGKKDSFGQSLSFAEDASLAIGAGGYRYRELRGESSAARGINGDQEDNSSVRSGAVYLY